MSGHELCYDMGYIVYMKTGLYFAVYCIQPIYHNSSIVHCIEMKNAIPLLPIYLGKCIILKEWFMEKIIMIHSMETESA